MTPTEAGFDGCAGIRVPNAGGPRTRFIPERSKKLPSALPEQNYRERLMWLYPDGAPHQLLWCNADNQWFELSFTPIQKP